MPHFAVGLFYYSSRLTWLVKGRPVDARRFVGALLVPWMTDATACDSAVHQRKKVNSPAGKGSIITAPACYHTWPDIKRRLMQNPIFHGAPPYRVAVVHGGPGATGDMRPVALVLSRMYGVLEPLQTEKTLEGQIGELRILLDQNGNLPVCLIGHSWGAWLSYLVAAYFPELVSRLILVSSAPFTDGFAADVQSTRASRLTVAENVEYTLAIKELFAANASDKPALLDKLGKLAGKADSFDPIEEISGQRPGVNDSAEIFQSVWTEAADLRSSGKLLSLGKKIQCPVVVVHGDYDPHPVEGVKVPLQKVIGNFGMHLIPRCGHTPWRERQARDAFF